MGEPRGFVNYQRKISGKEPVDQRLKHYREFLTILPNEELVRQGARCMDCGVPFCHNGCPLGNIIPDFNDLVYRNQWREAVHRLHSTNNFPEFTGRVCPAPCETACVLGINEDPVAIKQIEMAIADRAFAEGWVVAEPPQQRTDKRVAIVGSGPAGLAAAQQLNRAGHHVTVFERADRPGGLLMYGIPDFKLEKWQVERRIRQMEEEGVVFRCNANIGFDIPTESLVNEFDAVLLSGGATLGRDLTIPGREIPGVHFAMEFLPQQNKKNAGDTLEEQISAEGKDVIVIGGGDTGSDCDGTSNRQGAKSLTQFELLPKPPDVGNYPRAHERPASTPWPLWPIILRTSSSHEEGCRREWGILTKEFIADAQGKLASLRTVRIEWYCDNESGQQKFRELPDTQEVWPCQLALMAMGFMGPEQKGPVSDLRLELDARGNVKAGRDFMTSRSGVFAAGDMRRGQSLVVWAIHEGREAARSIDLWLTGQTNLPSAMAADFAAHAGTI
jgi:glutamate synthase (NADPH/NADH) small chain